jgi:L-fucose mutarotase/ribose pyranase (RbsD/FucU family)
MRHILNVLSRAEKACACVMTGELARYVNIFLKEGVTPVS